MSAVVVTGVGVWTGAAPNAAAWATGVPTGPEERAPGAGLDRRTKRRASPLTRALAEVFTEATGHAGVDPAVVPAVFGSALGEAQTMIGLLDQMWREHGPLSPAKFALSVHNAASGMVSISAKNTGFTTSLAADWDTPAMALLEGMGLVATTGHPVVVVCGDEAAPADLVPEPARFDMLAAAVVLAPARGNSGALATLSGLRIGAATLPPPEVAGPLSRNPQVGLLDLVDALIVQRRGSLRLDRGMGRGWCVDLGPST